MVPAVPVVFKRRLFQAGEGQVRLPAGVLLLAAVPAGAMGRAQEGVLPEIRACSTERNGRDQSDARIDRPRDETPAYCRSHPF